MNSSPPFGQADLTNCERELIHLTGSVQPHGVLVVVRASDLVVMQVTVNCAGLLGQPAQALVGHPLEVLGDALAAEVRGLAREHALAEPAPLQASVLVAGAPRPFEGFIHRLPEGLLLVELEPVEPLGPAAPAVTLEASRLVAVVEAAVQRLGLASSVERLAEVAVRSYRELVGYDRVMVYRFDPDGHGSIIAEARDEKLDSLLGHHYPATDIPQRARELYLRNKLRVLVDVNYTPAPLEPRRPPGAQGDLDLSMSCLRSMSPLHLQYLKNMGVTATLVMSLVREGKLWGLVACHHYSPRNLRLAVRAAADLLAEVISSRLAAIEGYAQTQVALQVRRLEQRLIEATSTEGDWRMALLRNPRTLLQPLDATGAVLFFDGEVLTTGEVPSTPELRALVGWVSSQRDPTFYATSAIAADNPALGALTPTASGVLAVRLSTSRPDYLLWFRREQLQTVTWAGDPSKPMIANDPLELSPRRSFAAWSEIVRGTAVRWSEGELATGKAFGAALVGIIVQVNAVRLLISEQQRGQLRALLGASNEPVLVADATGTLLFANERLLALAQRPQPVGTTHLAELFRHPDRLRRRLQELAADRQAWRGEEELTRPDGSAVSVAVRAEVVPGRDGSVMGFFLLVDDLTEFKQALAARRHLEASLTTAEHGLATLEGGPQVGQPSRLLGAILSNASLSAMDIADAGATPSAVPLLRELEASTRRATSLYQRLLDYSQGPGPALERGDDDEGTPRGGS